MKKALIALAAVAMVSSAFADATIDFKSRTITKIDGSGSYDVPIWADNNAAGLGNVGAGTLAGGVTIGLFFGGNQLVSTTLRTASAQQFFTTSAQTATVPGVSPGTQQTLEVRAWQGASFTAAQATAGQQWGQWTFTSAKPVVLMPAAASTLRPA